MQAPPTCTGCKFYRSMADLYVFYQDCAHPECRKYDPIHGFLDISARDARSEEGACGPDARLFEERLSGWKRFKNFWLGSKADRGAVDHDAINRLGEKVVTGANMRR